MSRSRLNIRPSLPGARSSFRGESLFGRFSWSSKPMIAVGTVGPSGSNRCTLFLSAPIEGGSFTRLSSFRDDGNGNPSNETRTDYLRKKIAFSHYVVVSRALLLFVTIDMRNCHRSKCSK